jgi:hypothetical protein
LMYSLMMSAAIGSSSIIMHVKDLLFMGIKKD